MIKLYQLKRAWGIPNLCHFCCKTETYLRMTRLPYEMVATLPMKAPKGKLPYIEDQQVALADSRFIIDYLKRTYGDPLDGALSAHDQAVAHALQRTIEEHLYWVTMYTRWQYTQANWETNKAAIFSVLPPVIRDVAASYTRRQIIKQIHGHGTGRHQPEEIFALGKQDVDTLSDFLADKPYFMGATSTSLDATAFGFLINTLGCPIESPVKDHALTKANLVAYCERIKQQYYPDLAQLH